ncbi:S-layer homology domain-containing protein, partial [Patescibacteria group bacterium]|nr:S-layer homology domain-containing protein [Patescibacteria group bacterium]MBU1703265.1 S-layer homology domain-containing protein [Patescibacteria group bacterium]MBU1954239.1 S-layer homology domain-containing protein [Patescibacteria group bacterium]
ACASPKTYSDLVEGSHSFKVRATDSASNTDSTPASYSWTITEPDTTAPSAPTGLIRSTADTDDTPTFNWSASTDNVGVVSYEYQLDSGAFSNIGNSLTTTLSAISVGSHTFGIRAKDAAENTSGVSSLSFNITEGTPVEDTPPSEDLCAGFTDVAADDTDCEAIEYVKSTGAMTGNPDGTFDQDGLLQRDQIAKIVLETFGQFDIHENYCGGNDPFPDVTEDEWSYQYICRGVSLGMITGYLSGKDAGFYRLGRSVNNVEFLALLFRNLSDNMPDISSTSYADVETGQWYSGYAKYAKDNGLFTSTNLYPDNFISRGEVARVIFELHDLGKI